MKASSPSQFSMRKPELLFLVTSSLLLSRIPSTLGVRGVSSVIGDLICWDVSRELIQVSHSDRLVCGVDSKHQLYCKTGADAWVKNAGSFTHVSVSRGQVYAVNEDREVHYSESYGGSLQKVNGSFIQVDIDGNDVCGVNKDHEIWCATNANAPIWYMVPSCPMKHVSVNKGRMYGVNTDNQVYYSDDLAGSHWQFIPGTFKQVDVDGSAVCGVNGQFELWCMQGISEWRKVSDDRRYVSVDQIGVYTITSRDKNQYGGSLLYCT